MAHGESPPTGAELAALFDAALADLQDSIERRRRAIAPNGSVRSDADWGMIEEAFTLVCRAAFTLREVADNTRAARLKALETSSMSAVKPRVIRGLAAEAFMKASDLADALGDFDAAVSFADLAMTTVESLADFGRDRAEAELLGSVAGNAGWYRLRRNGPDDVASARTMLNDAAQWYRRGRPSR